MQLAEPSLGEATAAQPLVGGHPAGGGAEAGPGSFSLRPAVAASAEGTPRIGPAPTGHSLFTVWALGIQAMHVQGWALWKGPFTVVTLCPDTYTIL